jgi:hypothetical protein
LMDSHRVNVQDATLVVNHHASTCSARNAI